MAMFALLNFVASYTLISSAPVTSFNHHESGFLPIGNYLNGVKFPLRKIHRITQDEGNVSEPIGWRQDLSVVLNYDVTVQFQFLPSGYYPNPIPYTKVTFQIPNTIFTQKPFQRWQKDGTSDQFRRSAHKWIEDL